MKWNTRQGFVGKRPSLLMALEPRILYDGAGADVAAEVGAASLVPQDSGAPAAGQDAALDSAAPSDASAPAESGAAANDADDAAAGEEAVPAVSGQEETTGGSAGALAGTGQDGGNSAQESGSSDTGAVTTATVSETSSADTGTGSGSDTNATLTTFSADSADESTEESGTALLDADPGDQPISQVVFVDTTVQDHQRLLDGVIEASDNDDTDVNPTGTVGTSRYTVSGSTLVVTLGENPLDDIGATLSSCRDLDAVHIISHGGEGALRLGDTVIDGSSIERYQAFFGRLGESLGEEGDLLLYGCRVGRDGQGQAFVDRLAALSGADVNASDDNTGNASSGGDWDLEVATGPIEATPLLNEQNVLRWSGLLGIPNGPALVNLLDLNGGAVAVAPDTVRLTEALNNRSASAMSNVAIDLRRDFKLEFDARFSTVPYPPNGADGIALVLHNDPRAGHAVGELGQAMGAGGIKNGIAVEFDTHWNGQVPEGSANDNDRHHTSVWDTDAPPNTEFLVVDPGGTDPHLVDLPNLEDTQWHAVTVSWNAGSKELTYTIGNKTVTVPVDTARYFKSDSVYFGFTASTGNFINEQSVRLKSFTGNFVPSAQSDTVVATPGTPVTVDVLANDRDADVGDTLTIDSIFDETASATAIPVSPGGRITLASGTTVTLQHDGKLSIDMAQGTNNQEVFYYTVKDSQGRLSKATVLLQRDSDGDGVANIKDTDDDNDGILDINEGNKCVVEESFETPKSEKLHENWILNPVQAGQLDFTVEVGGAPVLNRVNIIGVGDGTPGEELYYNGAGPNVAQDGLQYLDLSSDATLLREFTLTENSLVDVSGWFSRRETASGTVKIDILDSANQVVFSTTSVDLADAGRDTWYLSQIVGQSLAAGTYTLRVDLPNNLNVDNIRVCTSRDSDGDGKADHLDIDSDNDGITDNVEAQATQGYQPPSGVDADKDGLDDAYGGAGLTPVDTDGDGRADVLDADSDNDGIADIAERGDGQPTTLTSPADTDGDGLLDIFEGGTVSDGFTPADNNWNGGVFTLKGAPTLNPDGSNAVPLTRDLLFRDVNDPPGAVDDAVTIPEDTPITGNVLGNDSDPDGDALTVSNASIDTNGDGTPDPLNLGTPTTLTNNAGVTIGTLILQANGNYTFTPALNYNGPVPELSYTVRDPGGRTATAKLKITVTPVNDPPVATPDNAVTPEDTPLNNINVLGNDSDPDGDPLSVTGATVDPAKGTVAVNPDGTLNFVPAPNYNGPAVITYTISDGHGGTATSTLTVTVTPVNDPPVANDDGPLTTAEDTPLSNIDVLGNDNDPDGDPLTVTGATVPPGQGTVVVNADGTLNFTPAADFTGTAVISYTVSDGHGGTSTATVTVNVTSVNDPPAAGDDSATTGRDKPVTIDVLSNDSDPDGDPLTVTGASVPPGQGTVVVNADGTITFTPTPGFTGTALISYTVSDGHGGTSTATVTVNVRPPHRDHKPPAPAAPPSDSDAPAAPGPRPPFGSTGLHLLTSTMTGQGRPSVPDIGADRAGSLASRMPVVEDTPRMLGVDTALDYDSNWDLLVGTDISQYIHDTVNHTWERVERWYGTGTPGTELLRYESLGGAQDPFNGFSSPVESRMLEDLGTLLDSILEDGALGGGLSGISPVMAESRTLQNQLSRADIMGREVDRLSRIMDGGH